MPWAMLAMMAMEAGKHYLVDKPNQDKANQLDAAKAQNSPWLNGFKGGNQAPTYDPTQGNSALSALMQGGVAGYSMDQNIDKFSQDQELRKAQLDYYNDYYKRKKIAPSGADKLTSSLNDPGAGQGGMGITQDQGFNNQLTPGPSDNPWSGMTEGMGMDTSGNPGLWNNPSMWEMSNFANA